ncbi:MAG: hypothetical protein CMH30_09140 [Micavibrio sp.]|nr:hypothetical protein [Micavibrio sp.]|tara:strand:+ start:1061 stop:1927 length:867 start_codon:yes stop_codon:yes gene_type:complete
MRVHSLLPLSALVLATVACSNGGSEEPVRSFEGDREIIIPSYKRYAESYGNVIARSMSSDENGFISYNQKALALDISNFTAAVVGLTAALDKAGYIEYSGVETPSIYDGMFLVTASGEIQEPNKENSNRTVSFSAAASLRLNKLELKDILIKQSGNDAKNGIEVNGYEDETYTSSSAYGNSYPGDTDVTIQREGKTLSLSARKSNIGYNLENTVNLMIENTSSEYGSAAAKRYLTAHFDMTVERNNELGGYAVFLMRDAMTGVITVGVDTTPNDKTDAHQITAEMTPY